MNVEVNLDSKFYSALIKISRSIIKRNLLYRILNIERTSQLNIRIYLYAEQTTHQG